ncbi:MAG: nitrile hydratase accessory protein [Acidimicrobiales bacterium]
MSTRLPVELDIDGMTAPPRANGELVFSAPWESRIFGITVALHQDRRFAWASFQQELIRSIGRWESGPAAGDASSYWSCWLDGLERLLAGLDVVAPAALADRAEELAARGEGHDDDHGDHGEHGEHGHGDEPR